MARFCRHWRRFCAVYLQTLLKRSKIEKPSSWNKRYRFSYSKENPRSIKKNIQSCLREAGFNHVFKDLDDPATEAYVKDIAGAEVEIEFLTDDSARNNKDKNVVIAGVVAQPLSYLTLSLETTLKFHTYSNVTGNVVTPGAWVLHKGLTFTKRKSSLKILKDLYGIWYVASQLGEFSERALDEFKALAKQHPKWFKTFQKNLHNWLNNASPSDWSKLEVQDPSGRLRKLNFEQIMNKILVPSVIS